MTIKKVFESENEIVEFLNQLRIDEKLISLIPTMGALHHGHLELIKQGAELSDIAVVSIFVNPKQFNNKSDLDNYPKTLDQDLKLIAELENVIVFAPSVKEMYPENFEDVHIELGVLNTVLEAEFRPGHFEGVVTVVHRLFEIIKPDYALFGKKDLQQLAVINVLAKKMHPEIQIVPCDIIREENGLASSSRNFRLSERELDDSAILFKALNYLKRNAFKKNLKEVIEETKKMVDESELQLEYLAVINTDTFEEIIEWESGSSACIAAYCGDVRLIDNLELIPRAVFC